MRQDFTAFRKILLTSALALPLSVFAGNIPQYKVTKGGTPYTEFLDGVPLSAMTFNGNAVLFADGRMFVGEEKTGEGFPIGFGFRLGGRVFDQFAISNHGNVYLGKGEVGYGTDAFRLGMATVAYGLYKADVSYKTEGEEGDRVLTIQYRNAVLNETTANKGKYSLQIRLYERDGRIEMAFKELDTCYGALGGFGTGLRGWDDDDTLLLTAAGLNKPIAVSSHKKVDMLESDSYINWDKDDYDRGYSPVFVFSPESEAVAPSDAPSGLSVEQMEDRALISCRRGADADATVVLISESPFTDADLPVDGETFRAGRDAKGNWFTKLGNATAVYYGNAEEINLTVPGIEAGKSYHVCAISANGYPAYGREGRAETALVSPQAAPRSLKAIYSSAEGIAMDCRADDPVIVAATAEGRPEFGAGYAGVFGAPDAGAEVGDVIPGGGTVVYVGEPGYFIADVQPNTLTYFRAWTVRDGRVSATAVDTAGIPAPSFPYEPGVEDYPLNSPLLGWSASDAGEFVPVDRAYEHDRAVCATSMDDSEVTLTTPALTSDGNMTLSFEFAMETEKEAAVGEEGQMLPQGYEPGRFGDTGYLRVKSGDIVLKEIREYGGTMKTVPVTGGNEDGSSSFTPVEVEIPHGGGDLSLTFAFSTPKKSRLYLRGLSLVRKAPVGVGGVDDGHASVAGDDTIYTVTGVALRNRRLEELPAGIYIVGGKKVIVR